MQHGADPQGAATLSLGAGLRHFRGQRQLRAYGVGASQRNNRLRAVSIAIGICLQVCEARAELQPVVHPERTVPSRHQCFFVFFAQGPLFFGRRAADEEHGADPPGLHGGLKSG